MGEQVRQGGSYSHSRRHHCREDGLDSSAQRILGEQNRIPPHGAYEGAGKSGSVRIRLVPAPRGSGVVGSPTMKKVLAFAGVADCFTCSCGHTRTKGNFMKATFEALRATYAYLTPDLWKPTYFTKPPFQEWSDHLSQSKPTIAY